MRTKHAILLTCAIIFTSVALTETSSIYQDQDTVARVFAGDILLDWMNITDLLQPAPPKRFGHGMVYIEGKNQLFMFGGLKANSGGGNFLSDTWIFDFTNKTWLDAYPSLYGRPSNRANPQICYDKADNCVFMFSGHGTTLNDLWKFNLTTGEWKVISSSGTKPSARSDGGFYYDENASKIILFGGAQHYDDTLVNDLWEYTVNNNSWVKINSKNAPPSERYGSTMFYDKYTGKGILYGGHNYTQKFADVWTYDAINQSWCNITQPEVKPLERYWNGWARDISTTDLYVFGGTKTGTGTDAFLNDTWLYDTKENKWREILTENNPRSRVTPRMVYDTTSNVVLLFGGIEFTGTNWGTDNIVYGDTWILGTLGNRTRFVEEIPEIITTGSQITTSTRSTAGWSIELGILAILTVFSYKRPWKKT